MEGRVEVHSVGRNCTHEDPRAVETWGYVRKLKKASVVRFHKAREGAMGQG